VLLAIDIGNTNIVLGLYEGETLRGHWRVATDPRRTADEYAVIVRSLAGACQSAAVGGVAVCSVVPAVTPALLEMSRSHLGQEPLVLGPDTYAGIDIEYDSPHDVGPDRIANAVAAYEKYGGPTIVADFGTATTYDAVSAGGAFLGGAIAPGIGISIEALFQRAARLGRVPLKRPSGAIGRTTAGCLQSGIIFGFAGQADAMVRRIAEEIGGRPRVIATGGLAGLVAEATSTIELVDPMLTLDGLKLIYGRSRPAGV
jgi:type III pantothenate kinase